MEYQFTVANFTEEVLQSKLPVLVDFYADWCTPCKMMAPLVERIAEEYDGQVKVGKCNTDANMPLAQKYRVASIPTFMIFKEGICVKVHTGTLTMDELCDMIDEAI